MGVDAIYYPCMSFNFDEHLGDNHYNCPVVAYYPETIAANMTMRGGTVLINDYVGPHVRHDFPEKMTETLQKYFGGIRLKDVRRAGGSGLCCPGCLSGCCGGRRAQRSLTGLALRGSESSAWRAVPITPIPKSTTVLTCC